MKFSTKSRYALRLMVDLSVHDSGECISLKDISSRQEISVKYLEQIVSQLTKAGLLLSTRGAQGGYRIAKKPHEITAGDVLRAMEGNLAPIACLEEGYGDCSRMSACQTIDFWSDLYKVLTDYVDGITLEDLKNVHRQKSSYDFSI